MTDEWKKKSEPIDVVEEENDELVSFPSSSSESTQSVFSKRKMKRRLSHNSLKISSKAMRMEVKVEKKSVDLFLIKKEESVGQESFNKSVMKSKVKDEVKENSEDGNEVKPLIEKKQEMKAERLEIREERKPSVKIEGAPSCIELDIKPERKKLIKTKVKCSRWLALAKKEPVDRKSRIRFKAGLKRGEKGEVKEEPQDKKEAKPVIKLELGLLLSIQQSPRTKTITFQLSDHIHNPL